MFLSAADCKTMGHVEFELKERGVAPTAQRLSLGFYLMHKADHPTVEDIFAWAETHMTKISLATVYNTLEVFEEAGLVRKFRFPHKEQLVFDTRTEDHHHFFDIRTQKLYDLPLDFVQLNYKKPRSMKVDSVQLVLSGHWPEGQSSITFKKSSKNPST
ncbi:MAG: transcriptional repressor [Bdellovibrio sp.]